MEKYFRIRQLDLSIEERIMLSSFELDLRTSTCLLGESGAGKSLLLKKLVSDSSCYETNGTIQFYFGETKKVDLWQEEVSFATLPLDYQQFLVKFMANKIALSSKYALVKKILLKPNFLFCDQLRLDVDDFRCLVQFLQRQNIVFFYVTNNIEEVIYFNYLIVLKNNQIAIEGKTKLVLKEEKLMKLLGFSLPFYVNLSKQLGYYGLVSEIYTNKEELEAALWQSK